MKELIENTYTTHKGVDVLVTPSCYFDAVSYPFHENFIEVDGIRMHYVDENKNAEKVLVLVHGEPTWGYLYRNIIPTLVKAGYRVIVPDLIGFGKSDKPKHKKEYSYAKSVAWFQEFLFDKLSLNNINLIVHDWGGLIALRLVANFPEKFKSVVAMNTAFPRIEGFNPVFYLWRLFVPVLLKLPFGRLMPLGTIRKMEKQDRLAYDAPFPSALYKAAPIIFPKLVPAFPWNKESKNNKLLWKKLCNYNKPFLTVFSDKDPFTKRVEEDFIKHIKGAQNIKHHKIKNAGHFLQEDEPELVCALIIDFLKTAVYFK